MTPPARWALCLCMVSRAALADPPPPEQTEERYYGSFRAGVATSVDGEAPSVLCLELAPLSRLSVEACGNGSGILDDRPAAEIAHFRAKAGLYRARLRGVTLEPLLGLGFAEMQLGADAEGFQFRGVSENGLATAGPEATAALRARTSLGRGWEAVGELSFSGAYFAHAQALARPQETFQPSLGLTLGLGF